MMFLYTQNLLQKFPKLGQNIERAKNATKLNSISNEYVFLAVVSLIIIFCYLFRKITVLFDFLCFLYYMCLSLQTLDSHGNRKEKHEILCGWIVISLIFLTDKLFSYFMRNYYIIHIGILTFLLHPQSNNISLIYDFFFTELKATNIIKSDITYDEYEINLIIESINIKNNDDVMEDKLIYCFVIVEPPSGRKHIPIGIEKSAFNTNKLSTRDGICIFNYPITLKPLNKLDGTLFIHVKEKDTNYSESNIIATIEIELNKIEKNNLELMKQIANNIEVTYKILLKKNN